MGVINHLLTGMILQVAYQLQKKKTRPNVAVGKNWPHQPEAVKQQSLRFRGQNATSKLHLFWLVVEPIHLENSSQIGEFPQGSGWKQKIVESTG